MVPCYVATDFELLQQLFLSDAKETSKVKLPQSVLNQGLETQSSEQL